MAEFPETQNMSNTLSLWLTMQDTRNDWPTNPQGTLFMVFCIAAAVILPIALGQPSLVEVGNTHESEMKVELQRFL